ncbi:SUN1 protein, partial [Rhinopomastus cyanomelas]|nr:SUN1 protein [Rhinopomastus cyanomelas]
SLGHCWPLQDSQADVLIHLPVKLRPTAITIQHMPEAAALLDISSAPRSFTVAVSLCWALGWGLVAGGKSTMGETLVSHVWDSGVFSLQTRTHKAFRALKLTVWKTWGQRGYTCIYQLQVHGK